MADQHVTLGRRLAQMRSVATRLQVAAAQARQYYHQQLHAISVVAKTVDTTIDIVDTNPDCDIVVTWNGKSADFINDPAQMHEIKMKIHDIEALGFRKRHEEHTGSAFAVQFVVR